MASRGGGGSGPHQPVAAVDSDMVLGAKADTSIFTRFAPSWAGLLYVTDRLWAEPAQNTEIVVRIEDTGRLIGVDAGRAPRLTGHRGSASRS